MCPCAAASKKTRMLKPLPGTLGKVCYEPLLDLRLYTQQLGRWLGTGKVASTVLQSYQSSDVKSTCLARSSSSLIDSDTFTPFSSASFRTCKASVVSSVYDMHLSRGRRDDLQLLYTVIKLHKWFLEIKNCGVLGFLSDGANARQYGLQPFPSAPSFLPWRVWRVWLSFLCLHS